MAYVLEPEIDQPTAELIVQLQLEDAAFYFESSKRKSRHPTSEETAFQLHNEELDGAFQFLADRRMAMSFAAAVQADGQTLANSQIEEDTATKDRDIASHWVENGSPVTLEDPQKESTALDDEILAKLQILYMSGLEGYHAIESVENTSTEIEQPESSTWAAQRNRQLSRQLHRYRKRE
ncbi:hypothetical protein UA08_02807 [Talaromyces atroroseus]|uniref:Uncharacterized protein n=1 Tax=Talaromyces atroroseus TaxID=1441469 RepID=A0A225AV68_TALAT|nr:hypothetical protein UA08_02807 [Talaromyces atroroseus]OKL62264.1 hypothetical protein UA08_02807 [Talaromyces atroroseus]